MDSAISIRIIANEQKRDGLFERLHIFCDRNNLTYKIQQNEPYWKTDGLFEIGIEISPAPIWNYGAWRAAYKFLFEQEFTIEWEPNEDISLCSYPAYDDLADLATYFVIFHIPSNNFVPKPSKTIRH